MPGGGPTIHGSTPFARGGPLTLLAVSLALFFTRWATCCREKAVLVAVYVERPRKRRLLANQQHHHHHHHHLYLHQAKRGAHGGGSNRKADLLNYSRHLRESARSGQSSPSLPNPKPVSHNHQPLMTQMIAVPSKPKNARVPACLGNWKIIIPSFLRSLTTSHPRKEKKKRKKNSGSTATRMKAVMKSFQVKEKKGFVSKLFASLRKHR
ncbi:unnamed protein product [Ilex paraguariensis]|uniref:Uncharacterized protein n=1 Tax=Ilex paraguariensis TaxID=185542 RepID=A0ABC8TW38_9AQUA